MTIKIVRLGSDRERDEGLRIGTVRRPPRGVRREEHASRNFYDVWFPNLAPSDDLLKISIPFKDEKAWKAFRRRFLAEMKQAGPLRDLALLAALSHQTNFSVGCYCENENYCHRSILLELFAARDADLGK